MNFGIRIRYRELDMGEKLTRKKRVRGGHKASATRLLTKAVEEMVASERPVDPFKLNQLGMSIKEKLEDIKVLEAEILTLVGEEELEGEIAQADLFKERIYSTLILIERASGRASQSNTVTSAAPPTTAGIIASTHARGSRARLPKLTIKPFSGKLTEWTPFWEPGIDYDETFFPVVKFQSIRILLALAVQNDMLLHQMDVVTAFLNGTLEEEIYMQQPDGYIQQGKEHLVCKLKKFLYGLKQSPRCWNKVFTEFMESIGFQQSSADPCIYVQNADTLSIVAVYVDDLIMATKTQEEMQQVKQLLQSRFKMKDLGELHYCLGIIIKYDMVGKLIEIHQKQYIMKMLEKYKLQDVKPVATPADLNVKLCKDDNVSKPVDSVLYRSMVGSLLYAAIATRPDIDQAVGVCLIVLLKSNRGSFNSCETNSMLIKGKLRCHSEVQEV